MSIQFEQSGRLEVMRTQGPNKEDYIAEMKKITGTVGPGHGNSSGRTFVLVLMPEKDQSDGNLYTSLKQLTLQTFVVTQCVLVNPTQKGGQRTKAQMTAVQVCAKLGGIPWHVESKFGLDPKGTMVIGTDFYHSEGMQERCILMGLLATMDITRMECWLRLKYRVDVSKIVYAGGPTHYAAAELPQTE